MLIFLTYYAQYYAYENTCIYTILYQIVVLLQKFSLRLFKIFPIMLALCLLFSETYYAQDYAGIIGLVLVIFAFLCNV